MFSIFDETIERRLFQRSQDGLQLFERHLVSRYFTKGDVRLEGPFVVGGIQTVGHGSCILGEREDLLRDIGG